MTKSIKNLLDKYGIECVYEIEELFLEKYRRTYSKNKVLVVGELLDLILTESQIKDTQLFLDKMGVDTEEMKKQKDFFDKINLDMYFIVEGIESEDVSIELYGVRFKEEEEEYLKELAKLIEQKEYEKAHLLTTNFTGQQNKDEEMEKYEQYLFELPEHVNKSEYFTEFVAQIRKMIEKEADKKFL